MGDRNSELSLEIVDGELSIRIGVSALCFAAVHAPYFDKAWARDESGGKYPVVLDEDAFAKAILSQLTRELGEDGLTLVHQMIDRAAEFAYENGARGISVPGDDDYPQDGLR